MKAQKIHQAQPPQAGLMVMPCSTAPHPTSIQLSTLYTSPTLHLLVQTGTSCRETNVGNPATPTTSCSHPAAITPPRCCPEAKGHCKSQQNQSLAVLIPPHHVSTGHHCHLAWQAVQDSLLLRHHKACTLPAPLSWLSQYPHSLPAACKASYQHSQTTKQFVFTTVIAHGDENLNRISAFLDANVSRDFLFGCFPTRIPHALHLLSHSLSLARLLQAGSWMPCLQGC